MTQLLICGFGRLPEAAARIEAAHPAIHVANPSEIADLTADQRSAISMMAFVGHTTLNGAVMDLLPNLAIISNYGVGYDSIDLDAATKRGIRLTNTPDVLNDDVADLAVAMLLDQFRTMRRGEDWVRSGRWAAEGGMSFNRKLSGSAVGIVGLGRIGREIADRLAAFKMDIHYTSRSVKDTPGWTYHEGVVDMARSVDTLVIALVGGEETRNHVSRAAIDALGPNGVIINISRGSTVDESALLDALESGAIAGAGLDVFLNEPHIDPRFLKLDNVVLQPHQGSATAQTRRAMLQLQIDNLTAFAEGRDLLTPVN